MIWYGTSHHWLTFMLLLEKLFVEHIAAYMCLFPLGPYIVEDFSIYFTVNDNNLVYVFLVSSECCLCHTNNKLLHSPPRLNHTISLTLSTKRPTPTQPCIPYRTFPPLIFQKGWIQRAIHPILVAAVIPRDVLCACGFLPAPVTFF